MNVNSGPKQASNSMLDQGASFPHMSGKHEASQAAVLCPCEQRKCHSTLELATLW